MEDAETIVTRKAALLEFFESGGLVGKGVPVAFGLADSPDKQRFAVVVSPWEIADDGVMFSIQIAIYAFREGQLIDTPVSACFATRKIAGGTHPTTFSKLPMRFCFAIANGTRVQEFRDIVYNYSEILSWRMI